MELKKKDKRTVSVNYFIFVYKKMMLNNRDCVKILKFYKVKIPKTRKMLKKQAAKIMTNHLCCRITKNTTKFRRPKRL